MEDDWLVRAAKRVLLVDDLPSERVATIEADGVVVRLPVDSSAMRIVAVAAYLGRLA